MLDLPNKNINEEPFKFFIGIVEDLDDPLMLGRVRVRIINEHDNGSEITTEDLPWAIPLLPITSASYTQVGQSPTGLLKKSRVFGFYLDNKNKNIPMIFATMNAIPENDKEKHDVNKLARGIQSLNKEKLGPEPDSAYEAEYPHNQVYQSKSGHIVEMDDTPGHERVHIYHKSGTYTEINEKGRTVRKIVDNDYDIVAKDREVYIGGKVNIVIKGDATIKVEGKCDLNVTKNLTATCKDFTVNCTNYTVKSSTATISGSTVDLKGKVNINSILQKGD
jgi:hypothetical protein